MKIVSVFQKTDSSVPFVTQKRAIIEEPAQMQPQYQLMLFLSCGRLQYEELTRKKNISAIDTTLIL